MLLQFKSSKLINPKIYKPKFVFILNKNQNLKFIANNQTFLVRKSCKMQLSSPLTASFKTLSRQKPPNWSNRFRRDANDLTYSPKYLQQIQYVKKSPSFIKMKSMNIQSLQSKSKNPIKLAMEKYNITPTKSKIPKNMPQSDIKKSYSTNQTKMGLTQTRQTFFKHQKDEQTNQNPQLQRRHSKNLSPQCLKQKIYNDPKNFQLLKKSDLFIKRHQSLENLQKPSTTLQKNHISSDYGLCNFQFNSKTIQGNVHSKYGYNIDLSKCKTTKINNVNPILYNKYQQLNLKDFQNKRIKQLLAKQRSFKSYNSHQFFKAKQAGNGGMVDKFYDVTKEELDMIKKRGSLDIDFQKMTPRPQSTKKLGTQLQYPNSYKQISQSNLHRPLYQWQLIKRKLIISKQVINTKRGCNR